MDRHTAIDELIRLAADAESAAELGALRPIYFRVDEIAKHFPTDGDVQGRVGELKQLLVAKGTRLKEQSLASSSSPVTGSMRTPSDSGMSSSPAAGGPFTSTLATPPSGELRVPPPIFGAPGSGGYNSGTPAVPGSGENRQAGSADSGRLPTRPTAGVFTVPAPTGNNPVAPPKAVNVRSALWKGAALGGVGAIVLFVVLVNVARNRNGGGDGNNPPPPTETVSVEIQTTPSGASIQINGQEKGISNFKVDLAPGNYQILASLDGYDAVATAATVAAGMPPITINLSQQAQPLRISADWSTGKVVLDDQPPQDLKDGQFLLDRVQPGKHSVTVTSPMGNAAFTFDVAPGKNPEIIAAPTAKDALVVLMSTSSKQAKIYTSSPTELPVALDGAVVGNVGAAGYEFRDVRVGDRKLEVGEPGAKDRKSMMVSFSSNPILTAYIKTDLNVGTLAVRVGQESDVLIAVGNRTGWRTMKGLGRIQLAPGRYPVRLSKEGFEITPREQFVDITKGADSLLEFKATELPRVSNLRITNATPNATVSVGGAAIGRIGPDGSFTGPVSSLGDKEVELSLQGYQSRRVLKSFKAGDTATITEMQLTPALAGVRVVVKPDGIGATVQMKRDNDPVSRQVGGEIRDLPPGGYTFTAAAKGYTTENSRQTLTPGETKTVEITLRKIDGPTPPPPPPNKGMLISDFSGGTFEGGSLVIAPQGGARSRVAPGSGVYSFSITANSKENRKIRFALSHPDGKTDAFEIHKGQTRTGGKKGTKIPEKDTYTIELETSLNQIIFRVDGAVVGMINEAGRTMSGGTLSFQGDKGDPITVGNFRFTQR